MLDTLKRIGIVIFQRFFNIDDLAVKFPVCVKGILLEDSRILFLKNEKLIFDLPGGKLDPHQSVEDALIEEFKEETGLNITVGKLLDAKKEFINNRNILVLTYLVYNTDIEPIKISFENWSHQFILLSEIDNYPIKNWIKNLIKSKLK